MRSIRAAGRLMPGLLHSEGHMRAVLGNSVPPRSDEQLEPQVAARPERQT
ncbi:Scr1 family TA system antitoxin-like transcriptional regulator [Streptomyces prasinus]